MNSESASLQPKTHASGAPPCVVFVTGPRGAGKTLWIQHQIGGLAEKHMGADFAVLLAEEGRTRMTDFARDTPGVTVQQMLLPCICCPGMVDLPGALRALEAVSRSDWVFLEVPAVAAAGMLAEFDRALGWPRELTACLGCGIAGTRPFTLLNDSAGASGPRFADSGGERHPARPRCEGLIALIRPPR